MFSSHQPSSKQWRKQIKDIDGKSVACMLQRNLDKELLYHSWEKNPVVIWDVTAVPEVNSDLFLTKQKWGISESAIKS